MCVSSESKLAAPNFETPAVEVTVTVEVFGGFAFEEEEQ